MPKTFTLDNKSPPVEYTYLIFFSMLYMAVMLLNAILTDRYVALWENVFVLGGTLTSPFFFMIGDVIAEIFGYQVVKKLLLFGLCCQLIFSIICKLIIQAPFPVFFTHRYAYELVLGGLTYITISSFLAYFVSGLINARLLIKWKILVQGRYFLLRSIISSTIAEAIYSAIAILMMELTRLSFSDIIKVILISYTIKVVYSLVFSLPLNLFVQFVKKETLAA